MPEAAKTTPANNFTLKVNLTSAYAAMDPNTTAIKLAATDIQTELKKVAKKSPRLPENASLQAFNVGSKSIQG